MGFEHKPGSFSLFKNEQKKTDKHPDYRGEGKDLSGQSIEVAAWIKESSKGKFMSCTFKLATARSEKPVRDANKAFDEADDSIPF